MAISTSAIYYAKFKNHDLSTTYRVEILKDGYSGTHNELVNLAAEPLIFKHIDNENSNIQGSEMQFYFIAEKADYDNYDLITQGTEFEYELKVFYDANDYGPIWQGFIVPSETSRNYFSERSIYKVTATDYLTQLKYVAFTNKDGRLPVERQLVSTLLGWCLNKVPGFLGCNVQCGVKENSMGSANTLDEAYVRPLVFTKKRNDLIVNDSVYDVLDDILKVFNCKICSPAVHSSELSATGASRFWIINVDEVSSPRYRGYYNPSTDKMPLGYVDVADNSLTINSYKFSPESEFTKKFPLKSIELKQRNYDFGETFDTDDFSDLDNQSLWDRNGIASVSESNGIYSCQVNANTQGLFITSSSYAISNTNGNKYIRVSFTIKNTASINPSYSFLTNLLHFQVRIYKTNGTTYERTDKGLAIQCGQTFFFTGVLLDVYEVVDGGTYRIGILINNSTNPLVKTFEISNIVINTVYAESGSIQANVIYDTLYEGTIDESLTPSETIEVKIGDSDYDRNGSGITLSTNDSDYTSSWHRYGKTESKDLQELILQSYFQRLGGNARQLKLKVYDPGDTISLNKKIVFDSNTYQILDIEKLFKSSWVHLRLQKLASSDVSFNYLKKLKPEE